VVREPSVSGQQTSNSRSWLQDDPESVISIRGLHKSDVRVFESLQAIVYMSKTVLSLSRPTVSGTSMTPLAYAPRAYTPLSQHHSLGRNPVSYTTTCLIPHHARRHSLLGTSIAASSSVAIEQLMHGYIWLYMLLSFRRRSTCQSNPPCQYCGLIIPPLSKSNMYAAPYGLYVILRNCV
jgi:hypothetical protein